MFSLCVYIYTFFFIFFLVVFDIVIVLLFLFLFFCTFYFLIQTIHKQMRNSFRLLLCIRINPFQSVTFRHRLLFLCGPTAIRFYYIEKQNQVKSRRRSLFHAHRIAHIIKLLRITELLQFRTFDNNNK